MKINELNDPLVFPSGGETNLLAFLAAMRCLMLTIDGVMTGDRYSRVHMALNQKALHEYIWPALDEARAILQLLFQRGEWQPMASSDESPGQARNSTCSGATSRAKAKAQRDSRTGGARAKIVAALTHHHRYAQGGCLNTEPIGVNALAKLANVAGSTVSVFFQNACGGHTTYKNRCQDVHTLSMALRVFNGDISPITLYGSEPPGDRQRRDDEG